VRRRERERGVVVLAAWGSLAEGMGARGGTVRSSPSVGACEGAEEATPGRVAGAVAREVAFGS
jgi:hypothetical protein